MHNAPDGNIFGMILKGEIPSSEVYSNADVYCFLDLYPQNPGHTLVIPHGYSENVCAAPEKDVAACLAAVRLLTPAIKAAVDAKGITVITNMGREAGQMVEYLHFHIIPRHPGDKVSFYELGNEQTPEQLANMAEKIKAQLS